MSTYLLIPGGWHGGWWFRPLADRLRRRGHEVHAVTLTGLGERRHLAAASTNLDTHIADVLAVIEYEQLDDVVLCGHSYGCLVGAGVADRAGDRIASVIALDGQVPRDGESLWTLTTPAFRDMFAATSTDGISVPPPPGLDPRTTPHPLGAFLQPISLPRGGYDRVERKTFVHMAGWPDSPVEPMYRRVEHDPAWQVHVWPTGHDVIGEALDETEDLLLQAAGHPANRLPDATDRPRYSA